MRALENDEFCAMYGTQTSSQLLVAGVLQATGDSSSGTCACSNARDVGFNPALAGTANATALGNLRPQSQPASPSPRLAHNSYSPAPLPGELSQAPLSALGNSRH
jgi:hypothetical protein